MMPKKLYINKNYILLAGIFILSVAIRLIYLYQLKSSPLFEGSFAIDSGFYDTFALKILDGNFLYKNSLCLNPLYPFFLSFVYLFSGHSLTAAALSQIFLDSLSCIFLYFICMKVFKKSEIGLLASFVYACYGVAVFYTGFLLDTSLVTFLNVLLVLFVLYAKDSKRPALWFFAGMTIGTASLLKANIILFFPLLILWIFYNRKKDIKLSRRTVDFLFIIVGIAVMVVPFSVRNYMMNKRAMPLSSHGGITFYISNNPLSEGDYTLFPGIPPSPSGQLESFIQIAREETGEELTPEEASNHWFLKGFKFIKHNKRAYLLLALKKLRFFWNAEEIQVNLNYYFCKRFLPVLRAPLFTFGIIAPFALLGFLVATRKRSPGTDLIFLFIFSYIISSVLLYISSRQRLPSVPFIIMFGAYGFSNLVDLIRYRRKKELFLFSSLLIVAFLFVNRQDTAIKSINSFSSSYYNLGNKYLGKGMLDEAIKEYSQAIESAPNHAGAHNNLGICYLRKGMKKKAILEYKKAIEIDPGYWIAHFNLGIVYSQEGMPEEAMAQYKMVVELNPNHAEAHNNLAFFYYEKGNTEKAIYHYRQALDNGFRADLNFLKKLFGQ